MEETKNPPPCTPPTVRIRRRLYFKNVIVLALLYTLHYTSYVSVLYLQSSINKKLGTTAMSVIYFFNAVSGLLLPSYVMKKLTVKWTIPLAMTGFSLYIGAQMYPRYYTLVPSSALVGISAPLMMSAMGTYLTKAGEQYGKRFCGGDTEDAIFRFFSIFFSCYHTSKIWGNLISSLVLSKGKDDIARSEEFLENCGADFCPSFAPNITVAPNEAGFEEERQKVATLTYIYLSFTLMAPVLVAFFLDPLSRLGVEEDEQGAESKGRPNTLKLLSATFLQIIKLKQILITPLTFWMGMGSAFLTVDYTAGFVTCGVGVHLVGYVIICLGAANAISSGIFGHLVKKVGRPSIFIAGFIVQNIMLQFLLNWKQSAGGPPPFHVLFGVATMWGVTDAIWISQQYALIGVLFKDDSKAAFGALNIFSALGFMVTYILSGEICMRPKLHLIVGVINVAMVGYVIVEFRQRREEKETRKDKITIKEGTN